MGRPGTFVTISKIENEIVYFIVKYKNKEYTALIDYEDISILKNIYWRCSYTKVHKRVQAIVGSQGKNKYFLHRLIMGVTDSKQQIDHINNNVLDNRKCNLRICNNTQNSANKPKYKSNTSGYKCVSWSVTSKKWRAYIVVNDKQRHLGVFENKKDAAEAYNRAAIDLFEEFAQPNKIEKD